MTNWPNIQEYRNFEAKFFDNSKQEFNSSAESETVLKDEYRSIEEDFFVKPHLVQEPKTVRCIIKKDFEEAFKKLDRGDGIAVVPAKTQDPVPAAVVNKTRLQNHLKWMKQKEEEYLQRKEAERNAQKKKKEEMLKMEKIKKEKEKEKEEKLREWQEQKAREKEEKKREKIVMKMLEEELKDAAPTIDKERLIEEWVKLKNKQKQMEAEKKAEIVKKEEESRAVRQKLAKLSYMQWKERIKGRMMTLPKNGYQIFGPKPVPVVKEDWNHDFTSTGTESEEIGLKSIKSNSNATFNFQHGIRELEDLTKDIAFLDSLNSKAPSFYHLRTPKSGVNLYHPNELYKQKMPLKELQPGTIQLKSNQSKNVKSCLDIKKSYESQGLYAKRKDKNLSANLQYNDFNYLFSAKEDQNVLNKKPTINFENLYKTQVPIKKKIEVFMNNYSKNSEENIETIQKKETLKKKEIKAQKSIKPVKELNEAKKNATVEKHQRPKSNMGLKETKLVQKVPSECKKLPKPSACRRSKSYDKPVKKFKDREKPKLNTSASMDKIGKVVESSKPLRLTKSRGSFCQKRKVRTSKPNTAESGKKRTETKTKKKKKNVVLTKSLSYSESPYSAKRSIGKAKILTRKGEVKSERIGQSRKSTTKI